MFSVEQFIRSYRKESDITIALFHKMPSGGLDYKPTPGQRTTQELLRYLSFGPYNGVRRILLGDWTAGIPVNEATKTMSPSDFPARMAWQADEVARLLHAFSPVALEKESFTFPWGETLKKGEGLVNYPLKWITGYRMQLFLYLKSAGAHQLSTGDAWRPPAV